MIPRIMKSKLLELAQGFPAIAVMGPRQSGKTTLVKSTFPHYAYVSLEEMDQRSFASNDPRFFLDTYKEAKGLIIDEAQHVPELLSYIQTEIDTKDRPGFFILTGSQNFLLGEKISQTLAGRIANLNLLPLALNEHDKEDDLDQVLFTGGYPRVQSHQISPIDWYSSYIQTYVERDVRHVINIKDLLTFQRFMKLCAGRTGQLINASEIGRDCGVSYHTVNAWLSLLAASYLIHLLPPYYENFSKRIVKSPKLYFIDTGLACSLLDIESPKQLNSHYLRGGLFESFVISEILKRRYNQGRRSNCYFWRDRTGQEIDCIVESGDRRIPIEIKSGSTIRSDFFKQSTYWSKLTDQPAEDMLIVYGGKEQQKRSLGQVIGWKQIASTNF